MKLKNNVDEVLQEYAKIMQAKDEIKKTAQLAGAPALSEDEKAKLQAFLASLHTQPSQGPAMEKWVARLKGQADPEMKALHDALAQRLLLWQEGKDAKEIAMVPLPALQMAKAPAPLVHQSAANDQKTKTADQKAYEVMPDSDMIHAAHPQPVHTELTNKPAGDGALVENKAEQQEADLEVARKSAQIKNVLASLYKLAKQLQAEKNDAAYKMVKDAFMEIAAELKK